MLSILDRSNNPDDRRVSHREFLRVGSLVLGGLTLPALLAARVRATAARHYVKEKSVVLLFLQGGPPQHETFDPKFDVPDDVRSVTGAVQTSLPGVYLRGTFPKLAKLADRLTVVRSFAASKGGLSHEAGYTALLTAGNPSEAPLGALYARTAGAIHPQSGMPTTALILPEAVDPNLNRSRCKRW